MRLSQKNIPSLPRGEHRDDEVPGLIVVVRSHARSFALRYTMRNSGERYRITIGSCSVMTVGEARDRARKLLAGIWTGTNPAAVLRRADGLTVGDVVDRYLEHADLSAATRAEWQRLRHADISVVADRGAATLTRADIRALGAAIAQRSGYVANRVFSLLRRAYTWAVSRDFIDASPFVGLEKPFAGEVASSRVLSPDELRALLQTLDGLQGSDVAHHADAIELLLYSGVRRRAVREARRGNLVALGDADRAEWRVPPASQKLRQRERRTASAHVVPLSRQLVTVFRRRLRANGGAEVLFPRSHPGGPGAAPHVTWSSRFIRRLTVAMNARLMHPAPRWAVHNLRHTLATHGEELLGFPPHVTAAILGHKRYRPGATAVYARATFLQERREALQVWADWLDGLRWAPPRKGDIE